MAIIGTDKDEETQGQLPGSAPASTVGGGSYVGGGGQGATTTTGPSTAPSPTQSGSYTNLTSYMNANQGAGDQMANAVGKVIDDSGRDTENARNAYQSAGIAGAQKNTASVNPNIEKQISGSTVYADPTILNRISSGVNGSNYTGPGSVPTNYNGPQTMNAGSYGGPADATGIAERGAYTGLRQQLAGNLANVNSGQAGVASLLKGAGTFNQPSYTAGENSLDAFLTGGSQNFKNIQNDVNKQWGQEDQKGATADNVVNSAIGSAKKSYGDVQNKYNADIANAQAITANTAKTYNDAISRAQGQASSYVAPPPKPAPAALAPAAKPAAPVAVAPPPPTHYDGSPYQQLQDFVLKGKNMVTPQGNPGAWTGAGNTVKQPGWMDKRGMNDPKVKAARPVGEAFSRGVDSFAKNTKIHW